jgi:hypothetical protein
MPPLNAKSASGVRGANCSDILHEHLLGCQFGRITGLPRDPFVEYHFRMDSEELSKIPLLLRRIMHDATEAQLRDATAIFEDYMTIVSRILQRLDSVAELIGRLKDLKLADCRREPTSPRAQARRAIMSRYDNLRRMRTDCA